MRSFEDLGLGPALVEGLAAEGAEVPTPVQVDAIPSVRRGSPLLIRSGPGSGVGLAWAAGLLQRLLDEGEAEGGDDSETDTPRVLVLTPDEDSMRALARSIGRVAASCDLRVAALAPGWLDPGEADIVVGTPAATLEAVGIAALKLDQLIAVVVSEASIHQTATGLEMVGTVLELAPGGAQRIVTSLPLTGGVRSFVQARLKKAAEIPISLSPDEQHATPRGTLAYSVVDGRPEEALVDLLRAGSNEGPVLVFTRTEDGAADVGDFLSLHGHSVGRPGDPDTEVWIATDPHEARLQITEAEGAPVLTVSFDVPTGPDDLDRRHGQQPESVVFVRPRELPHLQATATLAHYRLAHRPEAVRGSGGSELSRLRSELESSAESDGLAPYLALIEPLLEEHSGVALAAAAVQLLHARGGGSEQTEDVSVVTVQTPASPHPSARGARPFVRLFISIGAKDRVRPGDIVGAIAGEAGVEGDRVGKVDIRDTFSLVEVEGVVAEQVIRALNGTTIRGRSVRADLDRGARRGGASTR